MEKESNNYLEVCQSNKIWDEFIAEANESSPFMYSWFIETLAQPNEKLFYMDKGKPKAAVLIYKESNKILQPNYSVYQSLCFKKNEKDNVSERFQIFDNILTQLTYEYKGEIRLSFHPLIKDVRPLLWHNYNEEKSAKFNCFIRYTALLNLNSISDVNDYLRSVRLNRCRDYKKSVKENISSSIGATKGEVINLYRKTFERQGIIVDLKSINFLERLTESLNSERGFVYVARNDRGVAIALTICLIDKDTAYSLIIANDYDYRGTGANTACLIDAIMYAKKLGKKYFDFVGANSPQRGDYKLSFNSNLEQYFEASCR